MTQAASVTFLDFSPGEKVTLQTQLRRLQGFVEHSAYDHVRIRWEDDTIGVLVFQWQLARLKHGWTRM
jgi:hypothetical protein